MSNAARRYLYADERGSIVAVADKEGMVTAINAYDEYGVTNNTLGSDLPNHGRFRYTGQLWLPELGMYYYKARMYSPTLGRFMQTDPIGYEDAFNLYGYVGNDPVNGIDPSGERVMLAIHEVAAGYYHAKILIIPDDQDAFRDDGRFQSEGGRVFATIGAGPDRPEVLRPLGDLISGVNRPRDVSEPFVIIADITPGTGDTENAMINRMFEADANYNDGLDYDGFPSNDPNAGALTDGYNSNSYIYGLLGSMGAEDIPMSNQTERPTPGAEKPVPEECFRKGNTC